MDTKFKYLRNTRNGMVIPFDANLADLPHMAATNDLKVKPPEPATVTFRTEEKPKPAAPEKPAETEKPAAPAPVTPPAPAVVPEPAAPTPAAETPAVTPPVAAPAVDPEVHLPRRRK